LGAVAFFLSVRFQVKGRLKERAAEAEEEAEDGHTAPELEPGYPSQQEISRTDQIKTGKN
jgi:hypothetical protein